MKIEKLQRPVEGASASQRRPYGGGVLLHRSTVSSFVALQSEHSKLHTSQAVRRVCGSALMSHISRLQVVQDGRAKATSGLDEFGLMRDGRNSVHSKSSTSDIASVPGFPIDKGDRMFSFCSYANRNPWGGLSARLAGAGPLRLGTA
jgi:hypothetical protein